MVRRFKWFVDCDLVVGAFAFRKPAEKYFDIAKSLDIYATFSKRSMRIMLTNWSLRSSFEKSIDGMLESLDPYTDYISEDEMETFRITTTGQYGGIGALIGSDQ